jgi:hypothetical protein
MANIRSTPFFVWLGAGWALMADRRTTLATLATLTISTTFQPIKESHEDFA